PLTGHTDTVTAVACTVLNDTPVAVTGSKDRSVRVWDLTSGRPISQPLVGHISAVIALACTVVDGTPIAIVGSSSGNALAMELSADRPLVASVTGHIGGVTAVACTVLDGTPVTVTGSHHGIAHVWNLRSRELTQSLIVPSCQVLTFTGDGELVIGIGTDVAVLRRPSDNTRAHGLWLSTWPRRPHGPTARISHPVEPGDHQAPRK
ncbi:WD40 repeat domain-containing protein, partial [Streptomyces sp. NPDC099088]|uniref:WD40 repeat domain-containing protein n=1 Tax=Streptomyces sp. NPDC099088 TaxID=3366101 RepID=UPI0038275121